MPTTPPTSTHDRYGRDWPSLVQLQTEQLSHLMKLLTAPTYQQLRDWCTRMNRPVDLPTLDMRYDPKLPEGFSALHSCPVGVDLWHWLLDYPKRAEEQLPPRPVRILSLSQGSKTKTQQKIHTMKEALLKFVAALAAAATELETDINALPDTPEGAGGEAGGGEEEITAESLLGLAKEAIAAGKRPDVEKLIKKAGGKKLSEVDEKHFKSLAAKFKALAEAAADI